MYNNHCHNDERRLAVLEHPLVNGIDFVEVVDNPSDPDDLRQTVLLIHFLKEIQLNSFEPENIIIRGGERITNIRVIEVTRADSSSPPVADGAANVLVVKLNRAGDFSIYQLQLIEDVGASIPPAGFDPVLSTIDFSFKIACPNEFDCIPRNECDTTKTAEQPAINYLAKDYASFRQLMLDRMALTMPDWKERNPADMGIMLVELLAYAADYLSYKQDTVATEAYLGTARQRISVKRHARLVDYKMHEGCNARTWVHIEVADGISGIVLPANNYTGNIKFVTAVPGKPTFIKANSFIADELFNSPDYEVFEPVYPLELDYRLNKLFFYTWGYRQYHLNKGSVTATIDGHIDGLPGRILVVQEEASPHTFKKADSNFSKRHALRVLSAKKEYDILAENPDNPADLSGRPVTTITWSEEDALPFSLCIHTINTNGEPVITATLSGNILLADHGHLVTEELSFSKENRTPVLKYAQLTNGTIPKPGSPASTMVNIGARQSKPFIRLYEKNIAALQWEPVSDLISSLFNSRHFVTETDNRGLTQLRFGNDINGRKPPEGILFRAVYRIGNGIKGNMATGALKHLVSDDPAINANSIISISNITPGVGGIDPETIEEVKYKAPVAFRRQERAVTMTDYEEKSRTENPHIQRTAATLRWTGSWRTVFLSVDTYGKQAINQLFISNLKTRLEKYRMAGQDLEVEKPDYVSLEVEIDICVLPGYARSDIKQAVLLKLSNKKLNNGETGFFHPDNFSFGQPVFLSAIYAIVQKQAGVSAVTIKKFQRLGINSPEALTLGRLNMGRTEIARLDNDPNSYERGILTLNLSGGN